METWYRRSGPTMDEVIKIVKTHKHFKDIDMEKYDDLINDAVNAEYIKYSGFGTYRGFYTFTLNTIIDNLEVVILNKIKNNIAFRKLVNSIILRQWVNHVLYRLPIEKSSEKRGLRVDKHKTHFNNSSSRSI